MDALKEFDKSLLPGQRKIVNRMTGPETIQEYLDSITYCNDEDYHGPLTLMKTRSGCCLEGALFAAAMFRRLGHAPVILELIAERDDNHIVALYKKNRCWGAVAKSNYVGLRARQPVYRTIRELALSYFELYYNLEGERTLRGFGAPLNLAPFDRIHWMTCDEKLFRIADRLDQVCHTLLFPKSAAAKMARIDRWMYKAGMLGTDVSKAYHPR